MNNWRKNTSLFLAVVFFIMLGIVQPVGAASSTKTVQAYQGVTIIYNGQQLTDTTPSYIIDGTTYIPLRMLMSNFGKGVEWNGTNKQVIISDATSGSITGSASQQIIALQNQIDQLQQTIATLDSRVSTLKGDSSDDASLSDIKSDLNDYFEDAGDDYFGDDGITASISLSGDEDDLAYTIKLDFSYADYYSDLTEVSTTDLKDLILAVKSRINSEIDDTYYEDADITGRIYDNDDSDYYVIYDGSSYTFSWN